MGVSGVTQTLGQLLGSTGARKSLKCYGPQPSIDNEKIIWSIETDHNCGTKFQRLSPDQIGLTSVAWPKRIGLSSMLAEKFYSIIFSTWLPES